MARYRLSTIRDEIGPESACDLDYLFKLCLGVYAMVDRAEAKNLQVLALFHRVDCANSRTVFRNTFN